MKTITFLISQEKDIISGLFGREELHYIINGYSGKNKECSDFLIYLRNEKEKKLKEY